MRFTFVPLAMSLVMLGICASFVKTTIAKRKDKPPMSQTQKQDREERREQRKRDRGEKQIPPPCKPTHTYDECPRKAWHY